jgi:uncharacterized membrane protein
MDPNQSPQQPPQQTPPQPEQPAPAAAPAPVAAPTPDVTPSAGAAAPGVKAPKNMKMVWIAVGVVVLLVLLAFLLLK